MIFNQSARMGGAEGERNPRVASVAGRSREPPDTRAKRDRWLVEASETDWSGDRRRAAWPTIKSGNEGD
jgi:hypothetical protein